MKTGFIDDEILQKAIDTFGIEAQKEMIIEECIELALALQKYKRVRGNKTDQFMAVIDEIADVKIMIRQAEKIFKTFLIDERVDFKMERLKKRIEEKIA